LAIVVGSLVDTGAMVSLPDLIKDVSPRTRIIIANDSSGAAAGIEIRTMSARGYDFRWLANFSFLFCWTGM